MLSRRQLIQGMGIGAASLALAACAAPGAGSATDVSATDPTVTWANWRNYIDEGGATLDQFASETGITVKYREIIEDNESFYASIKGYLQIGEFPGSDVFCVGDWMVARLIRLGYAQELNFDNIPNKKNLSPALLNPDFDPGRARSLPWQYGFTGVAWNMEEVPAGLQSVEDLWRPELNGRVIVLDDLRDTVGMVALNLGTDVSSAELDAEQFATAIDVLRAQVNAGQVYGIKRVADYLDEFDSGKALAGFAFASDIARLNREAGFEKFGFALPSAGGMLWGDNFVIPAGATHKANAEELINFYYEPEIAAAVAASVGATTPVVGARDIAGFKYPEIGSSPFVFPDDETLSKARIFRQLTAEEDQQFQADFEGVKQLCSVLVSGCEI